MDLDVSKLGKVEGQRALNLFEGYKARAFGKEFGEAITSAVDRGKAKETLDVLEKYFEDVLVYLPVSLAASLDSVGLLNRTAKLFVDIAEGRLP